MDRDLIILDADNTLYDWVSHFAGTFRGTLLDIMDVTGRSWSDLLAVARRLFADHQTVEYPYYTDPGLVGGDPELRRYAEERFWYHFDKTLRPYPDVLSGLSDLRCYGHRIVCYSDADPVSLGARLQRVGLLDLLDAVYVSAPRIGSPSRLARQKRLRVLPGGLRKPMVEALAYVARNEKMSLDRCVVLGDNLIKDVLMAKQSGAREVWARYGTASPGVDTDMLVSLTHWSPAQVAQFRNPDPVSLRVFPSRVADTFDEFVRFMLRAEELGSIPSPRIEGRRTVLTIEELDALQPPLVDAPVAPVAVLAHGA